MTNGLRRACRSATDVIETLTPRARIEFRAADHSYTLNGCEAVSVTTMLEAEGLHGSSFWKKEHRDRGTAAHKIAALLAKRPIRGATVEEIVANSAWDDKRTHPAIVPYGYGIAAWYLDTRFEPMLVEVPVGLPTLMICGTPDLCGLMAGKLTVVDFKTGRPMPAAHIQTALYAQGLLETYGLEVEQRVVVWVKAEATYQQLPPRPPGGQDLAIGRAAASLYHWRRRNHQLG